MEARPFSPVMEPPAVPVPPSWRLGARRLAIVGAVLSLVLPPGAARADKRPSTAPRPAQPDLAWTASEPEAQNCSRGRRKLWQPGEGWLVRTVTVCR